MGTTVTDLRNTHFFHVNETSDWLVLNVDFGTGLVTKNVYLLWDPLGRLRYQHHDVNSPRSVTIHKDPAKTSMNGVPGAIPAGEWRIDFLRKPAFTLHYETGNGRLSFALRPNVPDPGRDIWTDVSDGFDEAGNLVLSRYPWDRAHREGSGWYKGDLHLHSTQSDGNLSPDQVVRQAKEAGLDYIAATDHFVMPTSWPQTDLLVIPGTEVTTQAGHWNVLGFRRWFDWNPNAADGGMATEQGMNRLIRDANEAGSLCSINHPMFKGFEWTFHETDLSLVHALEIISAPEARDAALATEQALAVWNVLWSEGYRVAGVGGSDFHFNEVWYTGGEYQRIGSPTTCVWADRLSASGILEGIRAGHVYVTRGPELDAVIEIAGKQYLPGDDVTEAIREAAGSTVRYLLRIGGMSAGELIWVENGQPASRVAIAGDGTYETAFAWTAGEYVWARPELRSPAGELIAFATPVSSGARQPNNIHTWEQALRQAGFAPLDLKQPNALGW
ncbi:MAG: CehA/McbA family metallohydrolase [Paenibacillaceae bacterium]|nr:CehA/McbA family metallohydrolase [Paenibacillaceae bacterium]